MKNKNKIDKYRLITDFICSNFSFFDETEGVVIKESLVKDIAFFSQVVGKMETYLDKNDHENFKLMCEYFENEMDRRCYSIFDFELFVEDHIDVTQKSDAE